MDYREKIKLLRVNLPIGIKHAEKLLQRTSGNIDSAKQLFKTEMINIFIQKTFIDKEQANIYLENSNYDLGLAIQLYEKDKYNIAELCLKKYRSKKEALYRLLISIEQKYDHDFWMCWQTDNILLNKVEFTFAVLMKWIEYEGWEGDIIIHEKITELWKNLKAEWLFHLLQKVQIVKDKNELIDGYWNHETYNLLRITYNKREDELIDCLYNYVQENIKSF